MSFGFRPTKIPQASAAKVLLNELKSLKESPVAGFTIVNVDESDIYQWTVAIFGAPDTLYAGGYFKATIKFPGDYPFSPPSFRFKTRMWHPNIYDNGEVCISILHPPANTTQGGELPSERWNPTQSVRTIVISIISLLDAPNTFSPANVDASIMFRDFKEKKNFRYRDIVRATVLDSQGDAKRDKIDIPLTENDYLKGEKSKTDLNKTSSNISADSLELTLDTQSTVQDDSDSLEPTSRSSSNQSMCSFKKDNSGSQ